MSDSFKIVGVKAGDQKERSHPGESRYEEEKECNTDAEGDAGARVVADQVVHVMLEGKRALDAAMLDVGRLVAETLMYMEREERSGPDYHPTSSGLRKWASQRGSIYVGDQKLPVEHPRLRGPEGEVG